MDELTKKAIEEMANKKIEKVEKVENVENVEKVENVENKIILGKNKSVSIKPWTGKTKKKIKKFFENVTEEQEINISSIIKTIIYEYINEDVYLNEGEMQLILTKLYEESVSDEIETEIECPKCSKINKIKTNTKDIIHYKENELPFKFKNIELVDIKNFKTFEKEVDKIINSEDYDGITTEADIEVAMHININKPLKDVINYLDEIPLKESSEIIKTLREKLPNCELYIEKECNNCKNDVKFNIDISSLAFEELLK